ncbi:MAG: hypothetical protein ACI9HK_006092, partial [Pirellulaceae bacterium]
AAGLCLIIVVVIAFIYGKSAYDKSVNYRQAQIRQYEKKVRALEAKEQAALRDAGVLGEFEARALGTDVESSQTTYRSWILTECEEVGFDNILVKQQPSAPKDLGYGSSTIRVYHNLRFTVSAKADIQQLTTFLHTFYGHGWLHRINQMTVSPVAAQKKMNIALTIEALAMPGADAERELPNVKSKWLHHGDLDAYIKTVVHRNMFGLPNKKPAIDVSSRQSATVGKLFSTTVKGSDPDAIDTVRVRAVGDLPAGVTLSDSGGLSWRPEEESSIEVKLEVYDDGFPSLTDQAVVTISASNAPPPKPYIPPPAKPKFDVSKYTFITTIVAVNGVSEAWLIERTSGIKHVVKEGDPVEIGTFKGKVLTIQDRLVEFQLEEKRTLVSIGKSLSEGFDIANEDGV